MIGALHVCGFVLGWTEMVGYERTRISHYNIRNFLSGFNSLTNIYSKQ